MATDFETNNRAYLQAGLRWLRAVLLARAYQIEAQSPPVDASGAGPQAIAKPVDATARWSFGRRSRPEAPALALPAPPDTVELDAARDALDTAAAVTPAPALVSLAQSMGLSSFEQRMLLLCTAMELDPDLPALIAAAHGDASRRAPTFALGMTLFPDASWDALAPGRPLRALRLIEVHQAGATALIGAPLRVVERVGAYVKGLNYLDEQLAVVATVVAPPDTLSPSHRAIAERLERRMVVDARGTVVQLVGNDVDTKRDVAAAACAQTGRVLLAVSAAALASDGDASDAFLRLWTREALLMDIALFVDDHATVPGGNDERTVGDSGVQSPLKLDRLPGPLFVATRNPRSELVGTITIPVVEPPPAERVALWTAAFATHDLPHDDPLRLNRLAHEFRLSASRIGKTVAAVAPDASAGGDGIALAWSACVANAAHAIDGLAQRILPRATLADVQLPPHEREGLDRLVAHARSRGTALTDFGFAGSVGRGLGLAALFHGESGTGKTMAAEAVANALDLALFRVDLSSVMSKYIGETSKNLRRVFDAADSGGAVLLFDEADAVFGRRSEVKDSHDRFANIDTNYLLTRMEEFGGVTILATNMKHALDPAFLRRIRFVVGFGFPGVAERKAIWSGVFPASGKVGALDVGRLARFPLSGGSIFNAALSAAHAAAAADRDVEMPFVLDAIRHELTKLERPVSDFEFSVPTRVAATEKVA